MSSLSHFSAKPSHYNKESKYYDEFNETSSAVINQTIEHILKKYHVKTILDMTCGTGSQVFWLTRLGYTVVGSDINAAMLKIARNKAKQEKLAIKFFKGDMRNFQAGLFDAVVTIFNAIGHLTKSDFEQALQNIYKNLNEGGLYLFDINNLNYLLTDNNITKLTIDWQRNIGNTKVREIQYSTINDAGILASYTTSIIQKNGQKPKVSESSQTLQVYNAQQLKNILQKNGFKVLKQCAIDGSRFIEHKTDRILTIAKKQIPNKKELKKIWNVE